MVKRATAHEVANACALLGIPFQPASRRHDYVRPLRPASKPLSPLTRKLLAAGFGGRKS